MDIKKIAKRVPLFSAIDTFIFEGLFSSINKFLVFLSIIFGIISLSTGLFMDYGTPTENEMVLASLISNITFYGFLVILGTLVFSFFL
ncbi:MAG: hypothetical protein GF308_05810 [Candidatus Heimdallarchaeota archaeon]|nr:hypothetical protein [Candidatus Heimdallarchaeota archaeon]